MKSITNVSKYQAQTFKIRIIKQLKYHKQNVNHAVPLMMLSIVYKTSFG